MLEDLNSKMQDKEIEIQISKNSVEDLTKELTDLKEEIKQTKQTNNDLSQKTKTQYEEFKDLKTKLDLALKNNNNLEEELKEKLLELENTPEFVNNLRLTTSEEAYKSITGSTASFGTSYKLLLSMNEDKDREIINKFGDMQLHLPNIKRVFIDYVRINDSESIDKFLISCIPITLPLFSLNWGAPELLNGSQLIDGICKASQSVTKQILLGFIEFNSEEMQRIIRSATKTQSLVFRTCK